MAIPFAAIGAGLSAVSSFFGSSENDAIHAENKRRVAEIDAANQQRHYENLSIGARFKNKKARTQANLFNIDTAASEARAASQQEIDRQLDEFMLSNEDNYIKMMQRQRGSGSGRTNVSDRASRAMLGRRQSAQKAAQEKMYNQLLSKDYIRNRNIQNAKAQELFKVASSPIYQQYQTSYTPLKYKSKGIGDYLQLAGGLAGAASSGIDFFDSLKIGDPGKVNNVIPKQLTGTIS